jgi:heme A synthase
VFGNLIVSQFDTPSLYTRATELFGTVPVAEPSIRLLAPAFGVMVSVPPLVFWITKGNCDANWPAMAGSAKADPLVHFR